MQPPKLLEQLLIPTRLKRTVFFLFFDILLMALSFLVSFYLRFGFVYPVKYHSHYFKWIGIFVLVKIMALAFYNIYRLNWRFVGITEMSAILKSGVICTVFLFILNLGVRYLWTAHSLPRAVIVMDGIISFSLIGLLRISKRFYIELYNRGAVGKRTLIIGTDVTSERLVKELTANSKMIPVAFIDDNRMRIGTRINGLPVLGDYEKIEDAIKNETVETVLINLPGASHKKISQLFNLISKAGVDDIKIVPHVDEFNQSINVVKDIKNLDIDDLLSREAVKVDYAEIGTFLRDKTVLVSGAAGSIGSEIVRKLVQFGVKQIVGLEIDETEIFNLQIDLNRITTGDQTINLVVGDVRDRDKLERVFRTFKPEIVFHASAYKHVPLMEEHPEEALKNNIFGTLNIAETAVKYKVNRFINISTDKAVNPTSIMGATKRFSEMVCKSLNNRHTCFYSVRFGNVLGSRGSVIPLFLEQIKEGGPVTVTHPDIQRYFMSIPEAVLLVFQAAYMGSITGGEVFVLDMGEPVRIVNLAENLIRLNNMEPYNDVDIVFTGLRPGEKLFEELLTAEEGTDATSHAKIYVARETSKLTPEAIKGMLTDLEETLSVPGTVKNILKKYIPYYHETA